MHQCKNIVNMRDECDIKLIIMVLREFSVFLYFALFDFSLAYDNSLKK